MMEADLDLLLLSPPPPPCSRKEKDNCRQTSGTSSWHMHRLYILPITHKILSGRGDIGSPIAGPQEQKKKKPLSPNLLQNLQCPTCILRHAIVFKAISGRGEIKRQRKRERERERDQETEREREISTLVPRLFERGSRVSFSAKFY